MKSTVPSASPSTTTSRKVVKVLSHPTCPSVEGTVRLLNTVAAHVHEQHLKVVTATLAPLGFCPISLFHSLCTVALGYANLKPETTEAVLQQLLREDALTQAKNTAAVAAVGEPMFSVFALMEWIPTLEAYDVRDQAPTKAAGGTTQVSDMEIAALLKKLPLDFTPESIAQRKKLFQDFDPNGNGYLSLAEIDKGARDLLRITELFDCKPVLMRAFQTARVATPPSKANHNGDYVTKRTFRLLLWYLAKYMELWRVFSTVDEDGDRRIDKDELGRSLHKVQALLTSGKEGSSSTTMFLNNEEEVEELFEEMDRDGAGKVLFEEFAAWGLKAGAGMQLLDDEEEGEGED